MASNSALKGKASTLNGAGDLFSNGDPGLGFADLFFQNLIYLVPTSAAQPSAGAPSGTGGSVTAPDFIVSYGRGGGTGTGSTTTSSTSPGVTSVTTAGSGLTINLSWDSSVGSAPAGFQSDVVSAAKFIESLIGTTATVNLTVGYGEVGGYTLSSGALGQSISYLSSISYSNLLADLKATASTDGTDVSMLASLPSADPTGTNNYWLTTAQAKALGALSASSTATDGSIGFATSSYFTYGATNTSGTIASGTYDFFATVVHEITETMGRLNLVGTTGINGSSAFGLMDLTHYAAPGVRQFSQSNGSATNPGGYASVNGGQTSIGTFNAVAGGDAGDLAQPTADSINAFATSSVLAPFTANDTTLMDAIGWNLLNLTTSAPQAPTGVVFAPVTTSLAALQGSTGLTGGRAVAVAQEVGGVSGDSFTYKLSGTGASSFTISASGQIATASSGVAGALGGRLYSLAVTATDTTANVSSPAVPVNVVVGSGNGDTVNLAAIGGIATAAPTFVYGLAGADVINATGMTGAVYFDGGAGADVMTGGTGANRYEYGATTDSTPKLMDIITNFNVATDMIDLTGIGSRLKLAGALSGTGIGAHSVGWQSNGTDTFVYVNTSAKTESLTATNMKIDLTGIIPLGGSNILHA